MLDSRGHQDDDPVFNTVVTHSAFDVRDQALEAAQRARIEVPVDLAL